jgi:hypothetical protein
MIRRAFVVVAWSLISGSALGQAWAPPVDCVGTNKALQYQGRWLCATITGVQGPIGPAGPAGPQGPAGTGTSVPAQPPTSECITSHWDGVKWTCVLTEYLTAK